MKPLFCIIAVTLGSALTIPAFAVDSADYRAARERADAEFRMAEDRCHALRDHDREVCESEAKGHRDRAYADAREREDPHAARARCDALTGHARDECLEHAEDRH
jgi:hyperosmotically inducible protein